MVRSPCCSKEGLNRGAWTKTEDIILCEYIRIHGEGGWRTLPKKAGLKRCGKSCRLRWLNYLRPDIKRGGISPDEEELIIRLHRLLGNRWSLIAGRLPGRTDNEIKNYWNTCLSKKLLLSMTKSQSKVMKNVKSTSKSSPVQNRVFKTTPVKVTTAVRLSETIRPKGSINGYGCSNRSTDEAFKLCNAKETTNSSKSWCDLLGNDTEGRISTSSMSLALERSPNSYYFGADAATLADSLLDLNELSSPDCSLLSPPSNCSADFGLQDFCGEPVTLTAEANEFEVVSSDQSIMQRDKGFTVLDDQGIEEFYNHTQPLDWIHELDYIEKSSPRALSFLLLESEDEREEKLGDHTQIPDVV
uniref:Uncharacterized protein n=1 Tax=Picea sitchensis TaxID=3332 RepID=A9NSF0_PICSI|nr:unknown [Picea sitchensis]